MTDEPGLIGERIRLAVLLTMTALVLVFVNVQIVGKERIVRAGTTVLLPLAPADPRSLLQGDYMALRYAMTADVAEAARKAGVTDGTIVIELDENSAARFVALYRGGALTAGQHLLRFRKRGDSVRLASDAYFFEEGLQTVYRNARYGELRVDPAGAAVLIGMRDANAVPIR